MAIDAITDDKSVLLHAHTLARPGMTRIRLALYTTSTRDCCQMFIVQYAGPQLDAPIISNVRITLEDVTTEYVSEYYAWIMKGLAEEGFEEDTTTSSTGEPSTAQGKKVNTSLDQVRPYFRYPINEASKQLGICSTSLKKICRAHGLARWPYRKFKSVKTKMGVASSNNHNQMLQCEPAPEDLDAMMTPAPLCFSQAACTLAEPCNQLQHSIQSR